jgi:hypothetical protein
MLNPLSLPMTALAGIEGVTRRSQALQDSAEPSNRGRGAEPLVVLSDNKRPLGGAPPRHLATHTAGEPQVGRFWGRPRPANSAYLRWGDRGPGRICRKF